jgi:cytochrome c oxidase subunit 3
MGLFQQITEKPWLTAAGTVDERHGTGVYALATPHVGLRVFLCVATVVFSLFIVMYSDRMTYGDWRPLAEPWVLWLNTFMLVLGSLGLHWAQLGTVDDDLDRVRVGLIAGGAFTLLFLLGQIYVSQQLVAQGFFASTNPAYGFFYLLTAVHAIHLFGGLVAWGRTMIKLSQPDIVVGQVRMSVELCAIYWHFLLVVWVVLFVLLLFT